MRILVVDGDRDLLDVLVFALQRAGFEVAASLNAPAARNRLAETAADLLVLNVDLGGDSGLDLLRELRRGGSDLPVIMLGPGGESDRARGLELGADDYLAKPFSHRELVARIGAVLRHHGHPAAALPSTGGLLRAGPLTLNIPQHTAAIEGRPLRLTVTEFRLLQYLMEHAGTVVPTGAILARVWGPTHSRGPATVRLAVHRL